MNLYRYCHISLQIEWTLTLLALLTTLLFLIPICLVTGCAPSSVSLFLTPQCTTFSWSNARTSGPHHVHQSPPLEVSKLEVGALAAVFLITHRREGSKGINREEWGAQSMRQCPLVARRVPGSCPWGPVTSGISLQTASGFFSGWWVYPTPPHPPSSPFLKHVYLDFLSFASERILMVLCPLGHYLNYYSFVFISSEGKVCTSWGYWGLN